MNLILKHLWPKTKLSKEPSTNSSWLELFFDLIYVIIFSSLLNYSVNSNNLWTLFQIFTVIIFTMQIWVSVSMYSALVDMVSLKIRFSVFLQIFLLILLNYAIINFNTNPTLFFVIWIINMLYRLLWLLPVKNEQASFQALIPYTLLMICVVSIFVVFLNIMHFSMLVNHFVYFGLSIVIWISSFTKKIDAKNDVTLKLLEYMRERWGLIVLIMLAELLLSSINHFNHGMFEWKNIVTLAANIFYILNLWTFYYDQISHIGIKRNNIQLWSAMHVLLIFNLMVLGIATRIWIDKQMHVFNLQWLWIIANVTFFYLSAIIRNISSFEQDKFAKKYWCKERKNHIILNIVLGTSYLIIGPLFAIYLPKIFQYGLDTSLMLFISNMYIAYKYSQFLDISKNKKHTLKTWEQQET